MGLERSPTSGNPRGSNVSNAPETRTETSGAEAAANDLAALRGNVSRMENEMAQMNASIRGEGHVHQRDEHSHNHHHLRSPQQYARHGDQPRIRESASERDAGSQRGRSRATASSSDSDRSKKRLTKRQRDAAAEQIGDVAHFRIPAR